MIYAPKFDEFTAYYESHEQARYIHELEFENISIHADYERLQNKINTVLPKVNIHYVSNVCGPEYRVCVVFTEAQMYYGNYDLFAKHIAHTILSKCRDKKEAEDENV